MDKFGPELAATAAGGSGRGSQYSGGSGGGSGGGGFGGGGVPGAEPGLTRPGAFIFEFLNRININHATWETLQVTRGDRRPR